MNIFQDPSKTVPRRDSQIRRVEFEQQDLGAQKSFIGSAPKTGELSISHVPNAGGTGGGR